MRHNHYIYLLVFLALTGWRSMSAQVSEGGIPPGLSRQLAKSKAPVIHMPRFDIAAERARQFQKTIPHEKKAVVFAKTFDVNYSPQNSGVWTTLPWGDKLWRLGIRSDSAFSINLIFSRFNIPEGARVFIYNPEGKQVLGAFTSRNNHPSGILATSPVEGQEVIVEYIVPSRYKNFGELTIGQVGHDFIGIGLKLGNYGDSDVCNIDINCFPGSDTLNIKNSVARILINGKIYCTGALVNNTSQDKTPYLLTAYHCFNNVIPSAPFAELAQKTVFLFQYESPYCNGPDGIKSNSLSGSSYISGYQSADFSLVRLNDIPSIEYSPYYAGWDATGKIPINTLSVHHPQGDIKKISLDLDSATTATFNSNYLPLGHWKVIWDEGTTEAGSSGGPLFNDKNRIVGSLTGGGASCKNMSSPDYYAKFSLAYKYRQSPGEHLVTWLDPVQNGLLTVNGLDPHFQIKQSFDTTANINDKTDSIVAVLHPSWGYKSGHNSNEVSMYAEKFKSTGNRMMNGALFNVAKAYAGSPGSSIKITVWTGENYPAKLIYSKDFMINHFVPGRYNRVSFPDTLSISTGFYIGYQLNYDTPQDTFALYQAFDRGEAGLNTAFFNKDESWYAFNEHSTTGMSTSLDIRAITYLASSIPEPVKVDDNLLKVYPNPTRGMISIFTNRQVKITRPIQVIDVYGRPARVETRYEEGRYTADLTGLPKGMYLVSFFTEEATYTRKITLQP